MRDDVLALLEDRGAASVPHPGGTLLAHLQRVERRVHPLRLLRRSKTWSALPSTGLVHNRWTGETVASAARTFGASWTRSRRERHCFGGPAPPASNAGQEPVVLQIKIRPGLRWPTVVLGGDPAAGVSATQTS